MDESPFETLIRLDTDALAIGKGFDTDIMEYFRHNSSVGLAGKLEFARRGTHDSVTQQILDSATYKVYLIRPRRPQAMFAKFGLMTTLSRALKEGEKRGYRLAEYVFGGSYAFSRSCLEALRSNGHLPNKNLIWTDLSEDYLFGLLVRTAGFELGSLNGARLPFHVAHRQLPLSPEELRSCGAKVIHSVRRFNDRNESQIREFFRQYRE